MAQYVSMPFERALIGKPLQADQWKDIMVSMPFERALIGKMMARWHRTA